MQVIYATWLSLKCIQRSLIDSQFHLSVSLILHLCEGCEIMLFIVKDNQAKGKKRGN